MPAYIIAEIQVTDPTAYEWYRPLAAASVARYGGRFAVRGGNIDLLEGEPEPERIVVIEFPDADAARRWYRSEEYQKALKIRQSASRGRVFLVEGAQSSPSSTPPFGSRWVGKPAAISAAINTSTCRRFCVSTTT